MSIRDQVKERINFFRHNDEFNVERQRWRSLLRSLTTAEKNVANPNKKRRKRRANTSASQDTSEGTG